MDKGHNHKQLPIKTSSISLAILFVTGLFACGSSPSAVASHVLTEPVVAPHEPPLPPTETTSIKPKLNIAPVEIEQEQPSQPALKICLSPGHPSLEGDKLLEAIINRKVAYLLKDMLLQADFETLVVTNDLKQAEIFSPGFKSASELVKTSLAVMTPEEKAQACNKWEADYLISIHHNHSPNKSTNDAIVFYGGRQNFDPRFENAPRWAELTASKLGKAMKVTESESKSDIHSLGLQLTILQQAKMAGILTEASFYSNPDEMKRLEDNSYLEGEAKAIFDGLVEYLKGTK